MVIWEKLWYYGQNNGTIYWELLNFDLRRKNHGKLPNTKKLWFIIKKTMEIYPKIEVLNRFIAWELWFTMEKLWYFGKNYGTMEKTMILYRKLWNLIYYWKNDGTIVNYS